MRDPTHLNSISCRPVCPLPAQYGANVRAQRGEGDMPINPFTAGVYVATMMATVTVLREKVRHDQIGRLPEPPACTCHAMDVGVMLWLTDLCCKCHGLWPTYSAKSRLLYFAPSTCINTVTAGSPLLGDLQRVDHRGGGQLEPIHARPGRGLHGGQLLLHSTARQPQVGASLRLHLGTAGTASSSATCHHCFTPQPHGDSGTEVALPQLVLNIL